MNLGNEQQMNENLSAAGGGPGGSQNQSNNNENNGGGNVPDNDTTYMAKDAYFTPENKSFFDTVGDGARTIYDTYKKFSPLGLVGKGVGSLFEKLGDLRGFNEDGSRRTQEEYEDARQNRIDQNRISNIMGRDAPFTQMTLDNLSKLGYTGPMNQDLIGTTNAMRTMNDPTFGPVVPGTIYDAEEPDLGILSVAPKNAMDNVMSANSMMGEYYNTPIENRMANASGYNANDINLAGLNQEQVDYLNKVNEVNKEVGNNRLSTLHNSLRFPDQQAGAFFEYGSPQQVLDTVMGLNKQSATMFGNVNPEKNVYGDINTFAQPDEITSYIDSIGAPLEDGSKDRTYSFGIPQNEKGNKYMDLAKGGLASMFRQKALGDYF